MDFIIWDQSYSVGVKLIDTQHKKLFALISKLHATMAKTKEKEEPLDVIILDLAFYVDFHFRTEEKYMEEFSCVDAEHFKQHVFYEGKIKEFNDRYQKGESNINEEIMVFLKDWLANHIKIKDKEYAKCFNDHGLV